MANKLVEKSLPDLNNARARNLTFNFDYEKIEIPEAVKNTQKDVNISFILMDAKQITVIKKLWLDCWKNAAFAGQIHKKKPM